MKPYPPARFTLTRIAAAAAFGAATLAADAATFAVAHHFNGTDGSMPMAALVLDNALTTLHAFAGTTP